MSEEWRSIPSAPGWMASSEGRVWLPPRTVPMPKGGVKTLSVGPMKGRLNRGKNRFYISVGNRHRWVAPLICEAFHGAKPTAKHECMHLDEDSTNDRADNLAWGTRVENQTAPKVSQRRSEFMKAEWARRRAHV